MTGPYGPEQSYVRRLNPPSRPRIVYTKNRLYFSWEPDQAAAQYRLEISKSDSFTSTVDNVKTPQTSYAPLLTSRTMRTGASLLAPGQRRPGRQRRRIRPGTFKLPKALLIKAKTPRVKRNARSRLVLTVTDFEKKKIGKARVTVSRRRRQARHEAQRQEGHGGDRRAAAQEGHDRRQGHAVGYREGELRLTVVSCMPGVRDRCRDAGQSLVEYALLLALIGLVAVAAMQAIGNDIDDVFERASSALSPSVGGGGGGNGHGSGGNGAGQQRQRERQWRPERRAAGQQRRRPRQRRRLTGRRRVACRG